MNSLTKNTALIGQVASGALGKDMRHWSDKGGHMLVMPTAGDRYMSRVSMRSYIESGCTVKDWLFHRSQDIDLIFEELCPRIETPPRSLASYRVP